MSLRKTVGGPRSSRAGRESTSLGLLFGGWRLAGITCRLNNPRAYENLIWAGLQKHAA